jgi:hypothetical protein
MDAAVGDAEHNDVGVTSVRAEQQATPLEMWYAQPSGTLFCPPLVKLDVMQSKLPTVDQHKGDAVENVVGAVPCSPLHRRRCYS